MVSLIPISDANPTRRFPVVTVALIVMNLIAFFALEPGFGMTAEATNYFAENVAVPCQLQDECPDRPVQYSEEEDPVRIPDRGIVSFIGAILFSTFLHGGFLHIAGNMLYLWVFGNNVEDRMGPVVFLLFYLAAGIVAAYAQALPSPDSTTPLVGASGAIAGALGAYLVMFPSARVLTLVPIFFFLQLIELPAMLVLGFWFVLQALQGVGSLEAETGVAWFAHIGGFVFGALVALLFYRGRRVEPGFSY